MYFKFILSIIIISISGHNLIAADNCRDSVVVHDDEIPRYTFKINKLVAPAALTAAGAIGVGAFKGFKRSFNNDLKNWRGQNFWHGDDYMQYVPATAYIALGVCGVKSRSVLKERLLVGATSYICMAALVNITKVLVNEKRPDSNARNSFPSGHSATVFLGAELMRIEYGNFIGAAGYAVATGVGFLRMYNGRHWYNDVLAGAGIGILCARIGYWLLPFEKKMLKQKDSETIAVAIPYYNPSGKTVGLSFALNF